MVTFEGFEPVFGAGLGQLDSPTGHDALLSSLSYLGASDSDHLEMHATDFRVNTWFADMRTEFLEDLGTLISAMINEGIYFLLHRLQDHELPPLQLRPKLRLQQLQHRHLLLRHLLLRHLLHWHALLVFSRQVQHLVHLSFYGFEHVPRLQVPILDPSPTPPPGCVI
ncbi:hypothetical protein M758_3G088700 [Ceratodon purpureus]|nr:hypothetical protein M758_3G088700 [Ceratodon purpureus]